MAMAAVVATIPACAGPAPCNAEFGPWGDELPDVDMLVGDTVETSLKDRFVPADCFEGFLAQYGDSLFAVRSSNPAAVAVSFSGGVLTTAALDVTPCA